MLPDGFVVIRPRFWDPWYLVKGRATASMCPSQVNEQRRAVV
jgi:hypothetical protein